MWQYFALIAVSLLAVGSVLSIIFGASVAFLAQEVYESYAPSVPCPPRAAWVEVAQHGALYEVTYQVSGPGGLLGDTVTHAMSSEEFGAMSPPLALGAGVHIGSYCDDWSFSQEDTEWHISQGRVFESVAFLLQAAAPHVLFILIASFAAIHAEGHDDGGDTIGDMIELVEVGAEPTSAADDARPSAPGPRVILRVAAALFIGSMLWVMSFLLILGLVFVAEMFYVPVFDESTTCRPCPLEPRLRVATVLDVDCDPSSSDSEAGIFVRFLLEDEVGTNLGNYLEALSNRSLAGLGVASGRVLDAFQCESEPDYAGLEHPRVVKSVDPGFLYMILVVVVGISLECAMLIYIALIHFPTYLYARYVFEPLTGVDVLSTYVAFMREWADGIGKK